MVTIYHKHAWKHQNETHYFVQLIYAIGNEKSSITKNTRVVCHLSFEEDILFQRKVGKIYSKL
jgi:hypothetical protein